MFAGWRMPIKYTNSLKETAAVRNSAGVFDVSHMGRLRIRGEDAAGFLNYVTSNQVDVEVGRSRYTLTLNPEGGIKDDDMAFRIGPEEYVLVVNAASREKILSWFESVLEERGFRASVADETFDSAMLAVQGPSARDLVHKVIGTTIKIRKFRNTMLRVHGREALISRTGYTGEDGYEIILWDASVASELLRELVREGASPCGLGARDILRLEAGLPLYGEDMDEGTNPVEADLMFAVNLEKGEFIGKNAVEEALKSGSREKRVGLRSLSRRAPRHGNRLVKDGEPVGRVTSGVYSPTVGVGVAMGYVRSDLAEPGTRLVAEGAGRMEVQISSMPFYDTSRYGWRRKVG